MLAPAAVDAAALERARHQLLDALACVLLALRDPECLPWLGPPLPGMTMAGGARIPGTSLELDPVQGAFAFGLLLRWRDDGMHGEVHSWGHPADTLGALLALFDYRARRALHAGQPPPTVADLLRASVHAAQLQARLQLPAVSDDAGMRLRIATALVGAAGLGASAAQLHAALGECLRDGPCALRSERRWLSADAGSRGVWHALISLRRSDAVAPVPLSMAADEVAVHAAGRDTTLLLGRLETAVSAHFTPRQATRIVETLLPVEQLDGLRVSELVARFVRNS